MGLVQGTQSRPLGVTTAEELLHSRGRPVDGFHGRHQKISISIYLPGYFSWGYLHTFQFSFSTGVESQVRSLMKSPHPT